MPVEVIWDDDAQTIIRQIYSGQLTMQDYFRATDDLEHMARTKAYTVHSLMDRTQVKSTPGLVLPALNYANKHVPPNLGLRVVVNAGMFTRLVVDMGRRVAPQLVQNIHFVDTLEEGRAIIARHTSTEKTR